MPVLKEPEVELEKKNQEVLLGTKTKHKSFETIQPFKDELTPITIEQQQMKAEAIINQFQPATIHIPQKKEDFSTEALKEYSAPPLEIIAKNIVGAFKVALFGPKITNGGYSAINQLQQLARIYSTTITKNEEKELLNREFMRAYLKIVFQSFKNGYKKDDHRYNSVTAYQSVIEEFVRKLI
ncbi:MAG: hypothetical protein N3E37_02830 [Candidatus Micrarchaeota archaeon]|nr:hypothetical protein [Candidatus Micrarchaeota archaeon]